MRKKNLVALLFCILLISISALSANAQTCTYYVSSSTGNDRANGLTEAKAWKTINRLNQQTLIPGMTVCFKRGDTWRLPRDGYPDLKSGGPSGYVTYTAYGTGSKPLFLGSVEKNSLPDWQLTATANVWVSSGFLYNVGNLIFNNEGSIGDMVLVSEFAQTQCPEGYIKLGEQNRSGTIWSFCVGIDESQPDTRNLNKQGDFVYNWFNGQLLLYSTSNPAAYYSDIECALYHRIIDVSGKSYIKVSNLDLRYGGVDGIFATNASHITASDNYLSYLGGAIQNPTLPGWARTRFGGGIGFWNSINNIVVERNWISEIYEDALTIQGADSNQQHYIYFQNNIIINARWCFAFWNSYGGASSTSNIYFENNTCVYMGNGFGGQTYGPWGMGLKFTPQNQGNTSDFYVRNNIIYGTSGNSLIIDDAPDDQWNSMENLGQDYNAYYQPSGIMIYYPPCVWESEWMRWLNCEPYTMSEFASYQAASGLDAHSIAADPLFNNVLNNDFSPVISSPVCTMSNTGSYIGALPCVTASDSDSDGMPDYWEIQYDLDPYNHADAGYDFDSDGLTNLEEFQSRTDPINPDTDGDGIPDGSDNCPLGADSNQTCALITDYFNSILNRGPEPGEAEGWTSEIERIDALGIDIKEGFIVLGKLFFNSDEYLNMNTTDDEYIIDLYETFLGRTPTQEEIDGWAAELAGGLTRNLLLNYFIFSVEFMQYMTDYFGDTSVRPEYNLVNDLYRSLLSRLPDDGGFNYWLGEMQTAQCNGDPQAIRDLTSQIALLFLNSQEYADRNTSNSEFIEDLYNGILRRGTELAGYLFWLGELDGGTYTRAEMLQLFVASAEFQSRVQQVIDAGCAY